MSINDEIFGHAMKLIFKSKEDFTYAWSYFLSNSMYLFARVKVILKFCVFYFLFDK